MANILCSVIWDTEVVRLYLLPRTASTGDIPEVWLHNIWCNSRYTVKRKASNH